MQCHLKQINNQNKSKQMIDETLPTRLTEENETIARAERSIVEFQQKLEQIKNLFSEGKYTNAESISGSLEDLLRTMHFAIRRLAENEDFKIFKVGCTYKAVDFNSDGSKEYYFFTVVSRTKDTVTVTSSFYDWIADGKINNSYTWKSWQFDEELGKGKVTLDLYHHTYSYAYQIESPNYPRVDEYFDAFPFSTGRGPYVYAQNEEEVSDE